MLKTERTDRILETVRINKYVTVEQLVSKFHYSPATIRRDLTYLAEMGLVKKSYGGVSISDERPNIVREHENTSEKIKLCKYAERYIKDGDTVFIDGTTTTYFLGEVLLKKKKITVLTTNLKLATFLGEKGVNCFVTGGHVHDTNYLEGVYTLELIKKMRFDVAFFSVGAVSEHGEYSSHEGMWIFMQQVFARSKLNVLICDEKKLNIKSNRYVGDLSDFNIVLLNVPINEKIIEKYSKTKMIIVE